MVTGILGQVHGHLGWPLVGAVGAVLWVALIAVQFRKGSWNMGLLRTTQVFVVLLNIQIMLGILVWIMQARWTGQEALMSYEHPVTMIVGHSVFMVGNLLLRRTDNVDRKLRTALMWVTATMVVIGLGLARVKGLL